MKTLDLASGLKDESVLVVEDDDDVRSLLVSLLEPVCGRVETASDGREGLSKLAADRFAVVVCDLHMPNTHGAELCVTLRHEAPETAVLAVSGFLSDENAATLARLDVEFLAKPFRTTDLYQAIGRALDRLARERCP